ncbi:MAG TPA: toll/interleukin-1 receptor domain-containing protein, partial [Candidatus Eisenbacteria bacterium]|nr:toll/interleukin-1 receptor domain-containing protein [Candidatus Eisenbacteria bacterium]
MANPEHLAILKRGAKRWNEWRKKDRTVRPDLSAADLGAANLRGANLKEACLRDVNLADANLRGANLGLADLRNGNLAGADLSESRLVATNLSNTNLRGANLFEVYLYGADLEGADVAEAQIGLADFADLDLSVAKGLSTVRHLAPSTIGLDTIYKSRGRIPDTFLRGCGAPDEFIKSLPSLVASGFYSCFISYSTKDQEFADRLYADLQAKGVRCWFAPHDIMGGRKIHEQIDEAIRVHDKLLLILHPSKRKDGVRWGPRPCRSTAWRAIEWGRRLPTRASGRRGRRNRCCFRS